VTPQGVAVGYQRFGGPCCVHLHGEVIYVLHPEDGGSMVLRNVGILPQHYTASQRRKSRLESLPPWKFQNSAYLSRNCLS